MSATAILNKQEAFMIVGLIGPVTEDMHELSEMISSVRNIQVVDGIQVLRLSDRKTVNSLSIQQYHKQYFLKKLESELGTVLVSGNLIVSEDVAQWILENGGVVVIVARDYESYEAEVRERMEKYWDDPVIQKYNMEVRWKKLQERLQKYQGLYWVDVSEENSDQLGELLEKITECQDSIRTDMTVEDILKMTDVRKGDNTMTMEESIKNAMRELGMDVDGDKPEQPVKKTEPKVEPKVEKKQPVQKPAKQPEKKVAEDFINPPETSPKTDKFGQQDDTEDEDIASIFVKVSGDQMAVLLPVGLQMKKQTISGIEFNVATVSLPDLKSTKLQELPMVEETEQPVKPVKREPIVTDKEKSITQKVAEKVGKPMKTIVTSGDSGDLAAEKSRLDAEIKKYRQLGDIETVNELRKQRRAVRNKINRL